MHATDEPGGVWCSGMYLLFVGNSVISLVSSLKVPSCEERKKDHLYELGLCYQQLRQAVAL